MQRDSQENARRLYRAAVAQSGYFTSGQARQAGYACRWMESVNNWGKLGKWAFHVNKDPQTLGPELAHLAKTTSTQWRK